MPGPSTTMHPVTTCSPNEGSTLAGGLSSALAQCSTKCASLSAIDIGQGCCAAHIASPMGSQHTSPYDCIEAATAFHVSRSEGTVAWLGDVCLCLQIRALTTLHTASSTQRSSPAALL